MSSNTNPTNCRVCNETLGSLSENGQNVCEPCRKAICKAEAQADSFNNPFDAEDGNITGKL